jgi:hypothetical protein
MVKNRRKMVEKDALWSKSMQNGQKSTRNGQNESQSQMYEPAIKSQM